MDWAAPAVPVGAPAYPIIVSWAVPVVSSWRVRWLVELVLGVWTMGPGLDRKAVAVVIGALGPQLSVSEKVYRNEFIRMIELILLSSINSTCLTLAVGW